MLLLLVLALRANTAVPLSPYHGCDSYAPQTQVGVSEGERKRKKELVGRSYYTFIYF
jgi:hypothetical protein